MLHWNTSTPGPPLLGPTPDDILEAVLLLPRCTTMGPLRAEEPGGIHSRHYKLGPKVIWQLRVQFGARAVRSRITAARGGSSSRPVVVGPFPRRYEL
ncbi:hypothetical protein EVAR_76616_1 [Eumeta japonica]|uniref:Uncharacterized protein n=1 Tax=Eumeta variegata TaxID=151549 RepID=A0A4C1T869_EUMVA|nr:hypothetical protein EVAR_76616_1 [Eumeta japonica]